MLVLSVGSVFTLLAIYLTAFWVFAQTVDDYQGKSKKGNKSFIKVSIFMLFLILAFELVGFVNS